jgi:SecA DEAD-like domain
MKISSLYTWLTTVALVGLSVDAFGVQSPVCKQQARSSVSSYKHDADKHLTKRRDKPTTRLQMGIMEDFLTGRDASTRDKDNKQYLQGLQQRVNRINDLESSVEDLGDDELQAKTAEFRQRLQNGEDLNGSLLEETFAVVREAAW